MEITKQVFSREITEQVFFKGDNKVRFTKKTNKGRLSQGIRGEIVYLCSHSTPFTSELFGHISFIVAVEIEKM